LAPIERIFKSQINRENPDYAIRMWLLIDAVDSRTGNIGAATMNSERLSPRK
jgi:hypothetical protein